MTQSKAQLLLDKIDNLERLSRLLTQQFRSDWQAQINDHTANVSYFGITLQLAWIPQAILKHEQKLSRLRTTYDNKQARIRKQIEQLTDDLNTELFMTDATTEYSFELRHTDDDIDVTF